MNFRYKKILILVIWFLSACTPSGGVSYPASELPPTQFLETPSPFPNPTFTQALETPSQLPTSTTTATPDIFALKTQGIINPQVVAVLGSKMSPPIYSEKALFSPEGKMLATSFNNHITLWQVGSYKKLNDFQLLENYTVDRFAFNFDDKLLAVVATNWDNLSTHLFVWETTKGQQIMTLDLESALLIKGNQQPYHQRVSGISFVPNSNLLAFGNGNTVQLIDILDHEQKAILELGQNMYASDISFPSDGRFIYVFMNWWQDHDFPYRYRTKYAVQIWDSNSHVLRRILDFPEIECCGLKKITIHHSYLVTKDFQEGTLELMSLENDKVTQLPFRTGWDYLSRDNQFDIIMHYENVNDEQDKGIEFWTTDSWRNIYKLKPDFYISTDFPETAFGSDPGEITMSDDNALLAVVDSGQVFVYDVRVITSP